MKENEMGVIADGIAKIIKNQDQAVITKVKESILELTKKFPLYEGMSILS